jgi:N6-L-threonylcarbamoyladenine synthase
VCEQARADLAAATQAAIVDVLVAKAVRALQATGLRRLVVAGGVGANAELRQRLDEAGAKAKASVHYPELSLCTDNGAMIALAAAMRLQHGVERPQAATAFDVHPRWPLELIGI